MSEIKFKPGICYVTLLLIMTGNGAGLDVNWSLKCRRVVPCFSSFGSVVHVWHKRRKANVSSLWKMQHTGKKKRNPPLGWRDKTPVSLSLVR